jgi:hypothetical protein
MGSIARRAALLGGWSAALVAGASGGACLDRSRTWDGEAVLDAAAGFSAQWSLDSSARTLTVALSKSGQGFMGLGLAEQASGSMLGADIVTAYVATGETCKAVVEDWHVPFAAFPTKPYGGEYVYPNGSGFARVPTTPLRPVLDSSNGGCGDWEALEGVEEGGCTRVVMRRRLETQDANDRALTPGAPQVVLWAHGATDAVAYHGANRGVLSIDFAKSAPETPLAQVSCADCFSVDLRVKNFSIPATETNYVCQSVEVPASGEAHAIAFYPLIDKTKYVHHILVHSCQNDTYFKQYLKPARCGGGSVGTSPLGTRCQTLVYGWAMGGQPVILPEEAGVRLNAATNRFLMVEIHYNNIALSAGAVDASGVRMVVTRQLRQYDAATLVVGDPSLGFDTLPKGQPVVHRQGYCATNCTAQVLAPGTSVTVIANFMHMHSMGRQMYSNVYDSEMNFKSRISTVDFWNFEFQGFSSLRAPVTISSGDKIFTHCFYDTSGWKSTVPFGEGSLNEMCMGECRPACRAACAVLRAASCVL